MVDRPTSEGIITRIPKDHEIDGPYPGYQIGDFPMRATITGRLILQDQGHSVRSGQLTRSPKMVKNGLAMDSRTIFSPKGKNSDMRGIQGSGEIQRPLEPLVVLSHRCLDASKPSSCVTGRPIGVE